MVAQNRLSLTLQLAHFLGASLHPWSVRLLLNQERTPYATRQLLEAEHAGLLEAIAAPDIIQRMPTGQRPRLQQLLPRLPERAHAAIVRRHVAHEPGACSLDLGAEGWRAVAQSLSAVPDLDSVDVRSAGDRGRQWPTAVALAWCELPQLRRLCLCRSERLTSTYLICEPTALTALTELVLSDLQVTNASIVADPTLGNCDAFALGGRIAALPALVSLAFVRVDFGCASDGGVGTFGSIRRGLTAAEQTRLQCLRIEAVRGQIDAGDLC
jgi:hypothetical protein